MISDQGVKRFGKHENAFGFLRLLFASLVIVSHTPEIADGNRSRELLTTAFGTITFGAVAIHAFFLISGYLIVGSYIKDPRVLPYLTKRIVRIYPAFVVASLVCLLVIAPLSGGNLLPIGSWLPRALVRLAFLQSPEIVGAFEGSPYPVLNGATWTIAYEFRCYLLVILLGLAGAFRNPRMIASLVALGLVTYLIVPPEAFGRIDSKLAGTGYWLGILESAISLTTAFLTGSLYFLYHDKVLFRPLLLIAAVTLLACCLPFDRFAIMGLIVFGGYALFYTANCAKGIFTKINNKNDISYGIYLYAWPASKTMFWHFPSMPLLLNGAVTLVIALCAGAISWRYLEKPILRRSTAILKKLPADQGSVAGGQRARPS